MCMLTMAGKSVIFFAILNIQVFLVNSKTIPPPSASATSAPTSTATANTRRPPEDINSGVSYGYTDFSSTDADDIARLHNEHRASSTPPAADMKHMSWEASLATMAQNWADLCIYEHGGFEPNLSPFTKVGQNLFIGTGVGSGSGLLATKLWHDEEQYFTFDTNSCQPGEMCGHYTQVVWADTSFVGCGRKRCPQVQVGNEIWSSAYIIVCNYGPPGNVLGQSPFTEGEQCSKCPDDAAFCTPEGLCRDCTGQENEVVNCGVCNRQCHNCGTLDEETCTCKCAPGWDGLDCSDPCANHHEWCGSNPGWQTAEYCNIEPYSSYVPQHCREMCGSCTDASPVTEPPPTVKATKYCKTTFTSVANINQQLYAFKKEKFWRFDGIRNGQLLSSKSGDDTRVHFKKVNPDVRAVYQRDTDGKVLFFRGINYWEYSEDPHNNRWLRDDGFPRSIAEDIPGLPKSISAAMYDRFTGKTFFFKGAYVWCYDEWRQRFDYEKVLIGDVFRGLPSKLSGAFQDTNGDYIFVKGRDYWRVRYGDDMVESSEPQNLALAFMDCYE